MKIAFYYVSPEYIDYLKDCEIKSRGYTCVPNVIYANRNKFVYGAIFNINNVNYYVPVSHSLKNKSESIIIKNLKNPTKQLGSLRFNYMFPIPNSELLYLDVGKGNFSQKDIARIKHELSFCRKNRDKILNQAQKTYEKVISGNDENLIKNSCDFKLLEQKCSEYEQQKSMSELTKSETLNGNSIIENTSISTDFELENNINIDM